MRVFRRFRYNESACTSSGSVYGRTSLPVAKQVWVVGGSKTIASRDLCATELRVTVREYDPAKKRGIAVVDGNGSEVGLVGAWLSKAGIEFLRTGDALLCDATLNHVGSRYIAVNIRKI